VTDMEKWNDIVRQGKAHSVLYRQWKKKCSGITYTTHVDRHVSSPILLLFTDFKYCLVYDNV